MPQNYSNITGGLRVQTQIPLDYKKYSPSELSLSNLGINNNLAFTYYDGLIVFCREERSFWEWKEVLDPPQGEKLLNEDFIYPDNVEIDGVEYSLKPFNFFKIDNSYSAENIGSGEGLFFDLIDRVFQFKSIILNKPEGDGIDLISSISSDSAHVYINSKKISSETINISESDGIIKIELPSESSLNSLYVNQDYVPTYRDWLEAGGILNPLFFYKGNGSLGKPFTNSIRYSGENTFQIVPNTSIQNAIDAYIGSGTKSNPEKAFQYIRVQPSSSEYIYAGDFTIRNFRIEINGATISQLNNSVKLLDLDDVSVFPNNESGDIIIDGSKNSVLKIKTPISNSGTNIPSLNYQISKILYIRNITIFEEENYDSNFSLFELDKDSSRDFNNDGNICIQIDDCNVISRQNRILEIGGLSKIEFNRTTIKSSILTETINNNLLFSQHRGGTLRIFNCFLEITGNGVRQKCFNFIPRNIATPLSNFKPFLVVRNTRFTGFAENWFYKENNFSADVNISSCSSLFFAGNQLFFNVGSTKWDVVLTNNVFEQIQINFNQVDLTGNNTRSSLNTIGNNVIETLVRYGSRSAAISAGLPSGAKFLNTNGMPINSPDPSWKIDILL